MTLRCKSGAKSQMLHSGWALVLSLGVAAICMAHVAAQEGAQIPPAPVLKNKKDNSPDPEFRSPMRGDGAQQRDGKGDFGQRRRRLRERMEQMQSGGQPGMVQPGGTPEGGGPDAQSFRARGAGGGPRGMTMGTPFGIAGGGKKQLDLTPLNLTEQQKQEIKQLRQASRERAREMKQKVLQRQMALRELIFSADANETQIKAARRQLREAQNQMDEINLDDLLNIRRVLTAEQRQKLPDIAPAMPSQNAFGPRGGPAIGERRPQD